MRIGIDTAAMRRNPTGIETYIRNLVEHVARACEGDTLYAFANLQDLRRLRDRLPAGVRVIPVAFRWRPSRTFAHQVLVPLWALRLRLDVLHSTAFAAAFACPCPQVLTVQDMTYYTLPPRVRPPVDRFFRRMVLASMRHADRVIVPSQATKAAIHRRLPELPADRIRVIHLGVKTPRQPVARDAAAAVRRRLGIGEDYILYLGTLEPRKNLVRLVRAYVRSVTAHGCRAELVLAGKWGWHPEPLREALRQVPHPGRVHVPGYLSPPDAQALYAAARVFVYPSIEEGFGLPPLEAMASGTPVISSAVSSMSEVLSGAAVLVDPRDPEAIAEAIVSVLGNPRRAEELRAAGLERARRFTWERTAAKTLACYREAVDAGSI